MDALATATILAALVLLASMASVELGLSVAIIEIALGVFAGNILGLTSTPWIDFLAAFAGILLTFLAGAEVDPGLFRQRFRESVLIGGLSFAIPFVAAGLFAYVVAGWDLRQSEIAGIALSTTSLAVVYAVLVETGLTNTEIGKVIMAATFVTDLGTATALSVLFIEPTPFLAIFVAASVALIAGMLALQPWFFRRYGDRVIEPEIKGSRAAEALPRRRLFAPDAVLLPQRRDERQPRRARGRASPSRGVLPRQDRGEVRRGVSGIAPLVAPARDVHDSAHEHGPDVRHHLLATGSTRGSSTALSSRSSSRP